MCKICIFVASVSGQREEILCLSVCLLFLVSRFSASLFQCPAFVYHFDLAQFVTGRLSSYGLLVGFVCLFAQPAYGHQQVPGSTLKDLSGPVSSALLVAVVVYLSPSLSLSLISDWYVAGFAAVTLPSLILHILPSRFVHREKNHS